MLIIFLFNIFAQTDLNAQVGFYFTLIKFLI